LSALENRYAAALLHSAENAEEAMQMDELLSAVSAACTGNADFYAFLRNPLVPGGVKKDTLEKLFAKAAGKTKGTARAKTLHFTYVLLDKGRMGDIAPIARAYHTLLAEARDAVLLVVTGAFPLERRDLAALESRYSKKFGGRKIEIETRVEQTLLGGIRVQINDTLVDGTLSHRLKQLYRRLV
jgi:F-type H+-transporting ATPase subunit delta